MLDVLKTKIEITDLHVQMRIGCTEEERSKPQDIAFDVSIYFDARLACQSDKLEDTIDYLQIRELIHHMSKEYRGSMVEHFSSKCMHAMFDQFLLAEEIHFKIKKFSTMPDAQSISFSMIAKRPS